MSIGISKPVNQESVAQSLVDSELTSTLLDLRREQLELKAQTKENERRIESLHDTLSSNARHYGLTAQDFGTASRRKIPDINSVPNSDSIGQKIKSSIKNLGEKLFGFFKASNKMSDEEVFEPYLYAVDLALKEVKRGETFADYFYGNPEFEMTVVEPSKEEYEILYKMVIDEFLEKSQKGSKDNAASIEFMKRVALLSSDFIYADLDFTKKYKPEVEKRLSKAVARYLETALEDENLTKEISKSKSKFRAAVPGIISASFKLAQENSRNQTEFKEKLKEYTEKLDNYFLGIVRTVYNQDDPDESILALSNPEYDANDHELVLLNQVNDFLVEVQKFPSADQDLRAFLKHRPDLMATIESDVESLVSGMMVSLEGLNIHGSSSAFQKQKLDDPLKSFKFEDKFKDVAELVYSLISFKAVPSAQSKRLTDWLFSEEAGVKAQKENLLIDTELFIKDPKDSKRKKDFLANKQKVIYMYLMDSLDFNDKGKVVKFDTVRMNKLINAVRKAQGIKK